MGIIMDLNVRLAKMTKAMKTQLFIDNLTTIFNPQALFSDGTAQYRIPPEPKANESVKLRFRTGRENIDRVVLVVCTDTRIEMKKVYNDRLFDYYESTVELSDKMIDYYFEVTSGTVTVYYNSVGVCSGVEPYYNFTITPSFHTPDWAKGAIFYQIYVDRFYNGDRSNDVEKDEYVYIGEGTDKVTDWFKYPAAMGVREFYGGDIAGVWQKLDYLQELGVDAIYFNPIFVSPSNHKYDIQDYDYIDPHFGKIVSDEGDLLWPGDKDNMRATRYIDRVTNKANLEASNELFIHLVEEAHKRGMKVHAWFNPYRVSVNTKPGTIRELNSTLSQQPASVYVQHRDWIRTSGDRFVLDPGIPEVQDWITSIVAEVVSRYPVDGVQFDDYFYTESPGSRLNDNETYRKYGGAFASKADWRRNNTQQLIAKVSHTIKSIKPGVEFGVSPAGVWRNRSHDPLGSDTRGAAAYDESYADTRRWVEQGLLDYIAPQIYWPFSRSAARYDVLAKWWADVVKPTRTRLYIGIAFYKVGEPSKIEPDWMINGGVPELKKQLDLNDAVPEISGTILFREDYLNKPQTQQAVSYLQSRWGS